MLELWLLYKIMFFSVKTKNTTQNKKPSKINSTSNTGNYNTYAALQIITQLSNKQKKANKLKKKLTS